MNKSGLIFTFLLITCVKFSRNISLTSSLPVGEYQINVLKIITCDSTKQHNFHTNLYLNKISNTSSDFKGNITIDSIPMDDNLNLNCAFDIQDARGRFLPNTFVIKKNKACTTFKSLLNPKYYDAFGWNGTCPILPGVITTSGFPATNMNKALMNIPEIAHYGTYKFRMDFTNKKNERIGCFYNIIEVVHPQVKP